MCFGFRKQVISFPCFIFPESDNRFPESDNSFPESGFSFRKQVLCFRNHIFCFRIQVLAPPREHLSLTRWHFFEGGGGHGLITGAPHDGQVVEPALGISGRAALERVHRCLMGNGGWCYFAQFVLLCYCSPAFGAPTPPRLSLVLLLYVTISP